jgi:LCP family protein required for cell wall assembly
MNITGRHIVILVFAALFLLIGGVLVNYYLDAVDYKSSLIPKADVSHNPGDNAGQENGLADQNFNNNFNAANSTINILLLGIDKADNRSLGVYRSDTIVVVRINLETNQVKVLNIPRDTYTYVPIEGKKDKINHAYAFGSIAGNGVQASVDAVNEFLGQKTIDYYFLMSMDPIPAIIDGIGGLEIYVDTKMVDKDEYMDEAKTEYVTLEKGLQVINGKQAVTYLQWRNSPGGDIDRIERQRNFVSTLIKQQRENKRIIETMQIIMTYKDYIQTDLNTKQILGLAAFVNQLPEGSITYYNLSGYYKKINGISYWIPNNNEEVLSDFLAEP